LSESYETRLTGDQTGHTGANAVKPNRFDQNFEVKDAFDDCLGTADPACFKTGKTCDPKQPQVSESTNKKPDIAW